MDSPNSVYGLDEEQFIHSVTAYMNDDHIEKLIAKSWRNSKFSWQEWKTDGPVTPKSDAPAPLTLVLLTNDEDKIESFAKTWMNKAGPIVTLKIQGVPVGPITATGVVAFLPRDDLKCISRPDRLPEEPIMLMMRMRCRLER